MLSTNPEHLFQNTDPIDFEAAKEAIEKFYVFTKQPKPRVVCVAGIDDLKEKLQQETGLVEHDLSKYQEIAHFVTKRGSSK